MHVAVVGHEDLQEERTGREQDREQRFAPAQHQLSGGAHRGEVGADIDGIGDKQQEHDHADQRARQHARHVRREPFAGDPADPRADGLDRRHQRIGQRDGPHQVEAELRPHLGMGRDAARIVVRRAGDEARPEAAEPRCRRTDPSRFAHCAGSHWLVSVAAYTINIRCVPLK